ncbi:hypothetical protein D9M72_392110 [compost metagenome]
MVADQHRRAVGGDALGIDAAQPVKGMHQDPGDKAQQELRHQRVDIDRHHRIEQPHHQVQLRDAVAGQRHPHAQQRRRDHEEAVQDVVGGDDARAVRGRAAALDQRVQRHAVEAAEHRQQEQVGQHAPVPRLGQEAADAGERGRRLPVAGKVQVDGEHRHADRAERHQPDLDMAPGQPLAQQRAGADAQRKHRQQQRDHVLVAAQHILGIAEEGGQESRAEEPQPRNPEQAQKYRAIAARQHQVAPGLGNRVPVDAQVRLRRRRHRDPARHHAPGHGDRHAHGADIERPHHRAALLQSRQLAADQRADQDCDEGAHFHHAIAADQFAFIQVLRQVGKLDRPEQRGMQPHQEGAGVQQRRAVPGKAGQAQQHDGDFQRLDQPDQARLLQLVGDLPAGGGKQHERRDKDGRDQEGRAARVHALEQRRVVGHQRGEGDLEDVVVHRPQELGPEERGEAARAEQSELAVLAHG